MSFTWLLDIRHYRILKSDWLSKLLINTTELSSLWSLGKTEKRHEQMMFQVLHKAYKPLSFTGIIILT